MTDMMPEEILHSEATEMARKIKNELMKQMNIPLALDEACYRLAKAQIERDLALKGACKAVFRMTGEECALVKGHAGVHIGKDGKAWQNEATYMDAG